MRIEKEQVYVKRALKGDVNAFTHLVEAHKLSTYHLALSIVKNPDDAEEVGQDAFMKAYNGLSRFKGDASFSTWLYRIVYNTALSKIRKKHLETFSMDSDTATFDLQATERTFAALVEQDRGKYLRLALTRLGEESALMVELYYYHQKDMHEIAVILGMTHGQVRVRMTRARKKLKEYLEDLLKKETKDLL